MARAMKQHHTLQVVYRSDEATSPPSALSCVRENLGGHLGGV